MRPRHVHRVTPDDVGARVTLRRWLDGPGGDAGDVVGTLHAYADGVLTVETRTGTVTVDETTVLASRVIPDRPTRPA